jgi:hypothetical protein
MAVIFPDSQLTTSVPDGPDPLLPWLWFSLSLSLSLAHKSTLAFIVMNLLLFVVDPGRSRKLSKKTQGQG